MASLDGEYACTVETPMGDQQFLLTVKAEGDAFQGRASGGIGTLPIDGTVQGDTLAWTMAVSKPMPVTLTCNARVEGDRLEGTVKAGIFGAFPITGTRGG